MKRAFKAVLYFALAMGLIFCQIFIYTHPEATRWTVVVLGVLAVAAICWGMAGEYEPDEPGAYDPRE